MGKKLQQEYIVKEIVDRRDEKLSNGKSQTLYKVIWLGYPESQATWQSSRKLMRHPQLRKDIQLFNQKRKDIIKQAKNESKPRAKKGISQSFSIEQSYAGKSSVARKTPEPVTAIKLSKSQVASLTSKQPKQKNDQFVGQILSKIRENENLTNSNKRSTPRKTDPIIVEQTDKKITNKVKEKLSALKDNPKTTRKPAKKAEPNGQKNMSLDNIFPQPKIKLPDRISQSKEFDPIVEENKESHMGTSISSTIKSVIDRTVQEKSQENSNQKQDKSAEEKVNGIIEKIKLQLTEDLIPKESTKNKSNEPVGPSNEDEFEIKGMIMCKNEYFYLVEENGKSQILSRAEVLNTHPYELIVFYEKRINIKPAEINMMVL